MQKPKSYLVNAIPFWVLMPLLKMKNVSKMFKSRKSKTAKMIIRVMSSKITMSRLKTPELQNWYNLSVYRQRKKNSKTSMKCILTKYRGWRLIWLHKLFRKSLACLTKQDWVRRLLKDQWQEQKHLTSVSQHSIHSALKTMWRKNQSIRLDPPREIMSLPD